MQVYRVRTPHPGKLLEVWGGVGYRAWNLVEGVSIQGTPLLKLSYAKPWLCGGVGEDLMLVGATFSGRNKSCQPKIFRLRGRYWAIAKRSRRQWEVALTLRSHYEHGATWVPYGWRLVNGGQTTLLYEVATNVASQEGV